MINTLLEHVPIKMEVKDVDEATRNPANTELDNEMAKDDEKIDETDEEADDSRVVEEEDDEYEEDEDEEESDIESEVLEIEQEATMLISSDEEAELEAQRIRFPEIAVTKKLRKDSNKSSRSSSRNSEYSSNFSSNSHITYEIVPASCSAVEATKKKQRISPRLNNSENSKILENFNKENNNNAQALLEQTAESKKLENNKTLESNKNKTDETSKRIDNSRIPADNYKNSENNRNIENVLKSPVNVSGQKSRRGSNNSVCSVASTVASDSAETESCGNIYVFNLQQKLIFNCEFCDLKYGDLENFARHLHEAHKLFNFDEDPEKENAPRNLRKTNRMPNNAPKNSANVKKEPLQCLELMPEPPVALPLSVLAEPLDSCGNVFILNHRKLFLVCGYCECKYANLDLFEKHLRQQHRIFEGCSNEVNVVPKVEVKEEVYIITEVVEKPDVISLPAMVAIPAEIPLNITVAPENPTESINALEKTVESPEQVNKSISPSATLESKIPETAAVNDKENAQTVCANPIGERKDSFSEVVNTEKHSPKKTRNKRCITAVEPPPVPNKQPKRVTRNNARAQKESLTNIEEAQLPATILETGENAPIKINTESLQTKEARNKESKKSTKTMESVKISSSEIAETKKPTKSIESDNTRANVKSTSTRETRKSAKTAQKKQAMPAETKESKKPTRAVDARKQATTERTATKETRKSAKSSEMKKVKQEKPEVDTETDEDKLKCSTCSKGFARRDTLKIHERTHTGEKPYECDVCHKSFGARANLYMHKKFHLGDSYKKYKCEICDKKFFRNTDRKVHMSSHSSEKGFKCGICLRGYSSKLSVKKHIERDHIEDKFKKKSTRKDDLPKTKVEDDTIPQMPVTISSLTEPMHETSTTQTSNDMDDLNTDPVDEIIEQLQKEMVENERENVEGGAVTFTINAVAGSEVSTAHKSSDIRPIVLGSQLNEIDGTGDVKPTLLKIVKRFFCDMCPRTFEKHIRLVEHKRLHTGEKPFACDECGKQFRIRMRLNEHKLRHSKEKKFKCEICQLACCTKQDLNLHMRHHTNDRRYQCSMCPKAFVRSSDLKIHVRVHTGEKPYVCDICHKCFRANQNLSVHKKSHMGEASKTYKCEHCEKKFMRNIDRKVHMRSHTGEKPYKCEICQRGYSSKFNVRAHIERDHISANGVGTPPKGKKKPGPKPRALREELEKQKKLIEELQNQLLQQIKTDEKIIPAEDEMLQEHLLDDPPTRATSPLSSASTKVDPIQSAYELLNKLKSTSTTTSKPLTVIPSPPPLAEPPSNPFTKAKKDSESLLPLTITQKLDNASPASSASTSNSTSCLSTPLPQNKATATKVMSQKTSLGIQQVSVTVSMQVENVTPSPTLPEKENAGILTAASTGAGSVKKERKITSYFTVVGQKADI